MAFARDGFRLLHNGGVSATGVRMRVWTYITDEADTAVEANAYFDGVEDNGLAVGDVILAVVDADGTPELKNYIVRVGGADVTVALQSAT